MRATFSRTNVFRRDDFTCQYCYDVFNEKELTLDHVFPVSRGGKKTWENIVTACKKCNQSKGNKTPKEANLRLFKKPSVPKWQPDIYYEKKRARYPDAWRVYLSVV